MDVVVPCACGSRFSFQIESLPDGGKLPENAELACPACGKDGLAAANQALAQMAAPPQSAPSLPPIDLPPPAPEEKRSWFAKRKKKEEDDFDLDRPDEIYTGPNLKKGRAAAVAAAIVGTLIWYGLAHYFHREIRFAAIGVGALIGFSARKIGGGRDYHLGLFAAACACAAIMLGQALASRMELKQVSAKLAEGKYNERMTFAREALEITDDEDFAPLLALERSRLFNLVSPASITAEDVEAFKTNDLPVLKKFLEGQPSREEFIAVIRQDLDNRVSARDIFNYSLSPYIFLFLFLGTASAWKLASDYGTSVDFN